MYFSHKAGTKKRPLLNIPNIFCHLLYTEKFYGKQPKSLSKGYCFETVDKTRLFLRRNTDK
jgi:hypothetical protein